MQRAELCFFFWELRPPSKEQEHDELTPLKAVVNSFLGHLPTPSYLLLALEFCYSLLSRIRWMWQ